MRCPNPKEQTMRDLAQAEDKPMFETPSREDRIREAAYRRYLARGEREADSLIDWVEAEAEIDAEDARSSKVASASPGRR